MAVVVLLLVVVVMLNSGRNAYVTAGATEPRSAPTETPREQSKPFPSAF